MKHHTFVKLQERGWNYEKERMKSGNADLRKLLKEGHEILKEFGIQKEPFWLLFFMAQLN